MDRTGPLFLLNIIILVNVTFYIADYGSGFGYQPTTQPTRHAAYNPHLWGEKSYFNILFNEQSQYKISIVKYIGKIITSLEAEY